MKIGLPWIEKYRPSTLKEIIGQEEITKRIQSYVSKESLPNLLFTGPAGVGKTSTAVAIAREFFGRYPNWKRSTQEIKDEARKGWE